MTETTIGTDAAVEPWRGPWVRVWQPGTDGETYDRPADLWVTARYEDRNGGMELAISAVEGPRTNGDAIGGCGQCRDALAALDTYSPGWDAATCERLCETWERWHLNRMRAGSPAQRAYLEAHPVTAVYPESHYVKACEALAVVGLSPDPSHDGYLYGSAWLSEEVPADVLEWLYNLPRGTDRAHPWGRNG